MPPRTKARSRAIVLRREQRLAQERVHQSWVALVLIALFAFAVRAVHLLATADSAARTVLLTNEARYDAWARAILAGTAPQPPFDQPPLYAWVVATVYALAGSEPSAVLWMQALADAGHCLLLGWVAASVFGPRAGYAAGLLAALYGPFVAHVGQLLPASLAVLLLTTACTAVLRRSVPLSSGTWLAAVALRPEFFAAALLVTVWSWARGQLRLARGVLLGALFAVAGGSLVVSLAAWRPLPYSTGLGLNLWLGNNPAADGVNPLVPRSQEGFAERVRFEAGGDAWKAERAFFRAAVAFWRDFPRPALELAWKKLRWTFTDRELPNTVDLQWALSASPLFRFPFLLGFGALFVLAAAGLPLLRGRLEALWPFWAVAAIATATCVLFFTNARFRLPMAPLLVVLAGGTLSELLARIQGFRHHRMRRAQALAVVGCATAAAWLVYSNPYGVRFYRVPGLLANAGIAERLAGKPSQAIAWLEKALALDPGDEIAWVHLVLAWQQTGNARAALRALLQAGERLGRAPDLERAAQDFFGRHRLPWERWVAYRATMEPGTRAAFVRELEALLLAGDQPRVPSRTPGAIDSSPQKP